MMSAFVTMCTPLHVLSWTTANVATEWQQPALLNQCQANAGFIHEYLYMISTITFIVVIF